jgi:hypothetical protein
MSMFRCGDMMVRNVMDYDKSLLSLVVVGRTFILFLAFSHPLEASSNPASAQAFLNFAMMGFLFILSLGSVPE